MNAKLEKTGNFSYFLPNLKKVFFPNLYVFIAISAQKNIKLNSECAKNSLLKGRRLDNAGQCLTNSQTQKKMVSLKSNTCIGCQSYRKYLVYQLIFLQTNRSYKLLFLPACAMAVTLGHVYGHPLPLGFWTCCGHQVRCCNFLKIFNTSIESFLIH